MGNPLALTPADEELFELVRERDHELRFEPLNLFPTLMHPCVVKVLLVTDGGLDFGKGDFGLSAFVKSLLSGSTFYVQYEITIGHRGARSGDAMMGKEKRIARRISPIRFDNPAHFTPDMYDQVWLFGIDSSGGLADAERDRITQFMDAGGGLFATGDHGTLGKALSSTLPRARSMRLWDNTDGRVGMQDADRNDTNQRGNDASSEFNDQSDDVPQPIEPFLFTARSGLWQARFPHPLLCSPDGVLRVMPDHPHEGECIEPTDPNANYTVAGTTLPEYPPALDGSARPLPKVISTNSVLAGTTSGKISATQAHTFGGICAYDGHRAGVGRVVTDATWHHFTNINLIGDSMAVSPKDKGFLATSAGLDHLDEIRTYYRNIAVWISPSPKVHCMFRRVLLHSVFYGGLVEAVATLRDVRLDDAKVGLLNRVGHHARDVLGSHQGKCQTQEIAGWIVEEMFPTKDIAELDPWKQDPESDRDLDDEPPWCTIAPVLDIALGGAVLALRDEFGLRGEGLEAIAEGKLDEEVVDEVIRKGAKQALRRSTESLDEQLAACARKLASLRD